MEALRIEYEVGSMELNVRMFFPCNLKVAKKISSLINCGCTEEDRTALLLDLRDMVENYQRSIQESKSSLKEFKRRYAEMGFMSKSESVAMKRCEINIRENETLKKRVEKNIKLIEEGKRNGKI